MLLLDRIVMINQPNAKSMPIFQYRGFSTVSRANTSKSTASDYFFSLFFVLRYYALHTHPLVPHSTHGTHMYSRTHKLAHNAGTSPHITQHTQGHMLRSAHTRYAKWHKVLTRLLRPLRETFIKSLIFLHFLIHQKS